MLSNIAIKLLQNEFICKYTNADMFNEISKEDEVTKNQLESFLSVVGRTLQSSAGGTTFFAVHKPDAPNAKDEARKAFEMLREKIRPTLTFLQLMAEVNHKEGESKVFIQGGEILSVPDVIAGIERNQAHLSDLDRLIWVRKKDEALSVKVRLLFKELEKEGLLAVRDAKSERYIVTGKMDVMIDALAFIADIESIATESIQSLVDPRQQGFDL